MPVNPPSNPLPPLSPLPQFLNPPPTTLPISSSSSLSSSSFIPTTTSPLHPSPPPPPPPLLYTTTTHNNTTTTTTPCHPIDISPSSLSSLSIVPPLHYHHSPTPNSNSIVNTNSNNNNNNNISNSNTNNNNNSNSIPNYNHNSNIIPNNNNTPNTRLKRPNRPPPLQLSQSNLYSFTNRPPDQTRDSLKKLAQEQFTQSLAKPRNYYQYNPLQGQFTRSHQIHRPSFLLLKSTEIKDSQQHTQIPLSSTNTLNRLEPSTLSPLQPLQQQRKKPHRNQSRPIIYTKDSFDAQITTKRKKKKKSRSLKYFTRFFGRISFFSCLHHTSIGSSTHLPQLTIHPTPPKDTFPALDSSSSSPLPHRVKPSGIKGKKRVITPQKPNSNITPSRESDRAIGKDKGKQRAESVPRSRSDSLISKAEKPLHIRQKVTSTLSISTINTWCPYCFKTVPFEDHTDHHQEHHRLNLIPTPTPQRIYSTSSSNSYSPSSSPSTSSSSSSQSPIHSSPIDDNQSHISLHSIESSVSPTTTTTTSSNSIITSQLELNTLSTAYIPDTLFTFNHPLPHLIPTQFPASTSQPSIPFAVSTQEETFTPHTQNLKGAEDRRIGEPCLSTLPSLQDHSTKGLETNHRSSTPSPDKTSFNIRGFSGLNRSSSSTARGGGGGNKAAAPVAFPEGTTTTTTTTTPTQKRKSWSFFSTFRNRRTSLPATQYSSVDQDRSSSSFVKSQSSLFDYTLKQGWDHPKNQTRDPQNQQLPPLHPSAVAAATAKTTTTPVAVQVATPTQQHKSGTLPSSTDSKTKLSVVQEQSPSSSPLTDNASRHQSLLEASSTTKDNGSRKNSTTDKALPVIKYEQYPQQSQSQTQVDGQAQAQTQPQAQSTQKHQRRKSFITASLTSLKTSNLAKFVGGGNHASSPTSTLAPSNIPRSPAVLSPILPERKGDDTNQAAGNLILTMDQFKWSIISCCNEIKSRVAKQRLELTNISASLSNENIPAPQVPQVQFQQPTSSNSVPFSQWMFEKSKGSKTNSGPVPQGIETVSNDPRAILNSLLQIISTPTEEISQRTTTDTSATTTIAAVAGQRENGNTSAFYQASQPSQTHNPSLHSLGGAVGGVTDNPKRARSINQYPHFSASFQSLTPSVTSTAPVPPSPNSTSSSSATPPLPPQQQQQPRLRSKKSQTKLARAQATDSVLNPLSIEELVWLLGFTLTVAPQQELWIPWHLYDFFIKPQGFQYKDLVGMLPTDSQWIIRFILETVYQLVDYAVMMAVSQQGQQQCRLQPSQIHHQKSKSKTTAAMVAALGGEYNGGNGLRQQLSQAHLRTKSETGVVVGSKQSYENSVTNLVNALTAPDQGSSDNDNASQTESAIRARKRKIILESLANLVFRSRKEGSSGSESSLDRESMSGRQNLDVPAPSDDRIKTKRRYSYGLSGVPATSNTGGSSSNLMQTRASEMEREEGLRAFENLVAAFEKENQIQIAAKNSRKPAVVEPIVIPMTLDTNVNSNIASPSSVSLPSSPVHNNNPGLNPSNPPRQAISLPSPVASSSDADLATTVRSIPLSQRRKTDPLTNTVHLGQEQQNNRSHQGIAECVSKLAIHEVSPSSLTHPVSKADAMEIVDLEGQDSNSTNNVHIAAPAQEEEVEEKESTNNMTTSSVGNEQSLIRPHSEPARYKQKNYVSHSFTFSTPSSLPPSDRHRRKLSTVLSATWSAWKDHLLVLEEEEFVIEDGSDDGQESLMGSKKTSMEGGVGFLKENQKINEHNSDLNDGYSNNNSSNRQQQHIDIFTSFAAGPPSPPTTRKKSRGFGDLKQIALALENGGPLPE